MMLPLLAACSGSTPEQPAETEAPTTEEVAPATVRVGYAASANGLSALLAAEKYAADQQLTLELTPLTSGAEAIPKLLNGELDVALGDGLGTLNAAANGLPLAIFGINSEAPEDPDLDPTAIAVASPDTTLQTLEGKTLAVGQLGGAAELAARAAVDAAGGDSGQVEFIELEGSQAVGALQNGIVDAALLTEPQSTAAEQAGLTIIDRPAASGTPGLPATTWVTTLDFGSENEGVLKRLAAALQLANEELNGDSDGARAFAKANLDAPPAVLDVIRFPYFSQHVADTSGVRDYIELANRYGMLEQQPDADKLLSIDAG
jgi:NitT/TauT family transport system substrate-binding protein